MEFLKTSKRILIILLLCELMPKANAFEATLTFTGQGSINPIDQITVQNLTKGTSQIVLPNENLILNDDPSALNQINESTHGLRIFRNNQFYQLSFNSPKGGKTSIAIIGIDGRIEANIATQLQAGENKFRFNVPKGIYILKVFGEDCFYTLKFISQSSIINQPSISFLENSKQNNSLLRNAKSNPKMYFNIGDKLIFVAKSSNYTAIKSAIITDNKTINFNFIECKDADGNYYPTVEIGNQIWMAENLKTTKTRNWYSIPNIMDATDWSSLTTSAYSDYNNNTSQSSTFGRLYNWYAASDTVNIIAPDGWRVATDNDWSQLINSLGGETLASEKIKSNESNWTKNNFTFNESGFYALPSGFRDPNGSFSGQNISANWWSALEPWVRTISNNTIVERNSSNKREGCSIRCIKSTNNVPSVTTLQQSNLTFRNALISGKISSDGGSTIKTAGFCWSTNPNPDIHNSKIATPYDYRYDFNKLGYDSLLNKFKLNGLTDATTYYIKAFATNSEGTGYGNEIAFQTPQIDREILYKKIYDTFALTGYEQPAGDPDFASSDEGNTAFIRQLWNLNELPTDEAICSWGDAHIVELNMNKITPLNVASENLFRRLYFGIITCNKLINKIQNLTDSISIKQRAESRFLRALNYYHLMDLFGNVPFTEGLSYENTLQISRSSLFSYLEKELLDCEKDMFNPQEGPYYRVNKAANWLLLSRLYLNAETYTGTSRWRDAATYAKKVMDSNYKLCPTYKQLFMADNAGNIDNSSVNKASQEIIFAIPCDGKSYRSWGNSLFLIASTRINDMPNWGSIDCWSGNRARQSLVKKFFPNGITSAFIADKADLTTSVLPSYKDDRAMFYAAGNRTVTIGTIGMFINGYSVNKYTNVRADGGATQDTRYTDTDVPLMRSAEAYMNYAEAIFRSDSIANVAEALSIVNLIRARSKAKALTTLSKTTLLDERAREFFFEGFRRTDLIRFGCYGGGTYNWDWKGGVASGQPFDSHFNLYPLPSTELSKNPNWVQNPGY